MSSLNQNVIRHKIGLLNLATELGNVSKACKVMGLSRDTFYRYQNAVAEGGVEALVIPPELGAIRSRATRPWPAAVLA